MYWRGWNFLERGQEKNKERKRKQNSVEATPTRGIFEYEKDSI